MSGTSDDADLLAGEYVLGCLSDEEMRVLEARAATDPALAGMIAAWEIRLAPLAALAAPVAPPDALWERLEEAVSPAPVRLSVWRSVRFWRATTAGALALAAALAAIIVLRPPPPPGYVAALTATGSPAPGFVARTQRDGAILLTAIDPAPIPAGRDLQLWALPTGSSRPVSLGVIPPGGKRVSAADLPPGTGELLVSLEPAGGSPAPTGPVLYSGTLTRVD